MKSKFLSFFFPVVSFFRINLVGRLAYSELCALFDFLDLRETLGLYKKNIYVRRIVYTYIFFLLIQVISDVYNNSSFENYIRGWANILMAIVITSFFAKLFSKNPDLIIFYLAGEAIRYLFLGDNSVEFSDEISLNNMGFFKFRVVPALNALILIITFYMRKNSYSNIYILIVFLLYSFFCLAFDARSNGVFFILTAVIYYKRSALVKVNYKKFLPYALAAATTFQVMYSTYVYQVLQGNIGGEHSKTQLLRSGNPYNPLNLLTSGRSEFFVALVAIGEKPFLGHGSWPRDIDGKFNYMVYELHNEENKYDEQMKLIDTELSIPSHSVVLGAWLSAGLLGLFSIVYIMILFVKSFLLIMKNTQYLNSPFIGIVIFFFLNGLWTFLFSPTAAIKSNLPVFIGYIVVLGCHKSFAFNVSKRNFRRINKYEKAIN